MLIYKITNLKNGKCYIGQTIKTMSSRWKQHIRDCNRGVDYVLYRAIRKYGAGNFKIEQIDTAESKEELNKKEANYIVKENAMCYQNGYNMRSVDSRLHTSEETRSKISKASKKMWESKEYREKHSKSISKASLASKECKFNVHKSIKKGSSKKGEYVGAWLNQKTCSKCLNINAGDISSALKGKIAQSNGYVFEYEDNTLAKQTATNLKNTVYASNKHKEFEVFRYDRKTRIKGESLGKWVSQKECARHLKIKPSAIPSVLKGKLSQTQGYVFEYVNL